MQNVTTKIGELASEVTCDPTTGSEVREKLLALKISGADVVPLLDEVLNHGQETEKAAALLTLVNNAANDPLIADVVRFYIGARI
jgi:hypothetical protein